jgi:hypothetical protein
MHSLCIAELLVYGELMPAATQKLYLSVNVKCEVFFFSFLTKYGIPENIFKGVINVKLHGNSASGSRADTCGQMDRHDESNRRFS